LDKLKEDALEESIDVLRGKLADLEHEAANLRLGYSDITRKHNEAKAALRELVGLSLAAATRSAQAADISVLATRRAVVTAKEVADQKAFIPASISVQAASAASAAAVEAAFAATQAVSAAAKAVAHESEKDEYATLMKSIEQVEVQAKRAITDALEAVKLAYHAAQKLIPAGK